MNVKGKARHEFNLDISTGKCTLKWYNGLEASKWFAYEKAG